MKRIFKLVMLSCTMISILCSCNIEFIDDTTQDNQVQEVTTSVSIEDTILTTTQTESMTTQTSESITIIEETIQETTIETKFYTFRNSELYEQHYEKHGAEMDCNSPKEYLQKANDVINNPNSLHKLEAEDNDDIYYLESTGELVIVSTDGYIRTYFSATLDYFNRQ